MNSNDIAVIAKAAKTLVKAHKDRHKPYPFVTPNEQGALDHLKWVIAVAERKTQFGEDGDG